MLGRLRWGTSFSTKICALLFFSILMTACGSEGDLSTTKENEPSPTLTPTSAPTLTPTSAPTLIPTSTPTLTPTSVPTLMPTSTPTLVPTLRPTLIPTAVPSVIPTTPPSSGWIHCAQENEQCSFSGRKLVRFGANDAYAQRTAVDGILCSTSVFGDPLLNVVKTCEYTDAPPTTEAQWIWSSVQGTNKWAAFRKNLTLSGPAGSATARIAVDSKYWLWVNGELAVFEGGVKRGPNPNDTWYDEVDLTNYLQPGDNTLAILVWHFGKNASYSHKNSGLGGLFFDLDVDGQDILSDFSWKAIDHPAYEETVGGDVPNHRLPESNIRFNAQNDLANDTYSWIDPEFDVSSWDDAVELGYEGAWPWNNLVKSVIPLWKDSGLKDYTNSASFPRNSFGQTITANLPYNAQITAYLKIDSPRAGELIKIQTDAYNDGGEKNLRAEYVTKVGVQEFEALGWISGHNVQYSIPADVEILELKYRETGFNSEFKGTFSSDNDFYNSLWEKSKRTLYVNMRDTFFDCPTRERAQWWGDVVNQLSEVFYVFDSNAHSLVKKAILDLVNWRKGDGVIYSPIPNGTGAELPSQMLASVGEYGFWRYYFNTGDVSTIKAAYPKVKGYLEKWSMNANGLINYRAGGWNWGDWGNNIDRNIIQTTMYYMALKAAKEMAVLTGDTSDISTWESRMESIETAFDREYWQGNHYRSGDVAVPDDRANALAVVSGLADSSKFKDILHVLRAQTWASPYMERYVLEALFIMNEEDTSMTRMKGRYQAMVDSPYTTLWEFWVLGGAGTYNHAWNAPNTLLSEYALGVAPDSVAWSTYHVLPQEGLLTSISAKVPSIKGDIDVNISKTSSTYSLSVVSPQNTTATIGIPKDYFADLTSISVNQTVVWQNGTYTTDGIPGLNSANEDDEFVKFTVSPGTWTFIGSGSVTPENWTNCASEGGTCSFVGTKTVRYGANGQYYTGTFTDSVDCSYEVFGDPIYGTAKACEYLN